MNEGIIITDWVMLGAFLVWTLVIFWLGYVTGDNSRRRNEINQK